MCIRDSNETDNEAWCGSLGSWAEYFDEPCPDGFYGTCVIPVGGDYSAEALAHYYGDELDGESACDASGGTYSSAGGAAASDGGDSDTTGGESTGGGSTGGATGDAETGGTTGGD